MSRQQGTGAAKVSEPLILEPPPPPPKQDPDPCPGAIDALKLG